MHEAANRVSIYAFPLFGMKLVEVLYLLKFQTRSRHIEASTPGAAGNPFSHGGNFTIKSASCACEAAHDGKTSPCWGWDRRRRRRFSGRGVGHSDAALDGMNNSDFSGMN